MPDTTPYYERQLELAPTKATRFLNAVTAVPAIRRALHPIGLTEAELAQGRSLLLVALGEIPRAEAETPDALNAAAARTALIELDQSDEGLITRARAALDRHHPDLAARVLDGLKAGTGLVAIQAVTALVSRIRALPDAGNEGRAARDLLARRGFTDAELDRLDGLVKRALGDPDIMRAVGGPEAEAAAAAEAEANAQAAAARRAVLVQLDAWWRDWSQSARSVIRRRDHLIRLGLLKRRARPAAGEVEAFEADDDVVDEAP